MLKIKARLRHKTFVASFFSTFVAFLYQLLALFEIVPKVSEKEALEFIALGITLLASLGIVIDPTTEGLRDEVRKG